MWSSNFSRVLNVWAWHRLSPSVALDFTSSASVPCARLRLEVGRSIAIVRAKRIPAGRLCPAANLAELPRALLGNRAAVPMAQQQGQFHVEPVGADRAAPPGDCTPDPVLHGVGV